MGGIAFLMPEIHQGAVNAGSPVYVAQLFSPEESEYTGISRCICRNPAILEVVTPSGLYRHRSITGIAILGLKQTIACFKSMMLWSKSTCGSKDLLDGCCLRLSPGSSCAPAACGGRFAPPCFLPRFGRSRVRRRPRADHFLNRSLGRVKGVPLTAIGKERHHRR